MDDLERRHSTFRATTDETGKHIKGYAIVFNQRSLDLGGFVEIIAPEAVDRTLREGIDVRALVDHDRGKVLGRVQAGTLRIAKDAHGLSTDIAPDDGISYASDILKSVGRGDISGMSFGFRTLEDDWDYKGQIPIRTVLDMRVSEVSIVSFPAYPQTDVSVALRSMHEARQGRRSVAFLSRWHRNQLAR